MEEQKTIKQYAKEAKKRLKQGFWQNYSTALDEELMRAKSNGISETKVKEYYIEKVKGDIKSDNSEEEEFYKKVKEILDSEGEVSNAIGRLTDKEYYSTLTYSEQQKYTLSLSERYLRAVERYKKEKAISQA